MVYEITSMKEFQEQLSDPSRKIIIDFYADWCKPCQIMTPHFQELAKRFPLLSFYKINTDLHPDIMKLCHVTNLPSFVFIINQQIIHTIKGSDLQALVEYTMTF